MDYNKLTSFHLFAGAGGGILADILLGHNPIGAAEIEPYPRSVLVERQRDGSLPQFPIWDDVCTFDGRPWRGSVDILAGGFPCQDISAAGKGAGITGARSGLWKEYARIIGEMRPRFVFAENSPLLRTRGLGVILEDLAALGYHARWCVLGAGHVGAPHKRDRMWVLAYAKREQDNRERGFSECGRDTVGRESQTAFSENRETSANRFDGQSEAPAMAYATAQGLEGHDKREETAEHREDAGVFTGAESLNVSDTDEQRAQVPPDRRHTAEQVPWGDGSPGGAFWHTDPAENATEPFVGRVAHGVANRVDRLKSIGNGQVPTCAAVAWNILSKGLI